MFKRAFKELESSRDSFRAFLAKPVTAAIVLDTLRVEPGSFVDKKLRQSCSDLLFRTMLKCGGEARVDLLFEHRSRPEPDHALQAVALRRQDLGAGWGSALRRPSTPLQALCG